MSDQHSQNLLQDLLAEAEKLQDGVSAPQRRKSVKRIMELLGNDRLVQALDETTTRFLLTGGADEGASRSDHKRSSKARDLTWGEILYTFQGFLREEFATCAEDSKRTQARASQLKTNCGVPFHELIKLIEGRGPKLYYAICEDKLLQLFADVFEDPWLSSVLAQDLLPPLQDILSTSAYANVISSEVFRQLSNVLLTRIRTIISELERSANHLRALDLSQQADAELFARALALLIEAFIGDLDEDMPHLLRSLSDVLRDYQRSNQVTAILFQAINSILLRAGVNDPLAARANLPDLFPVIESLFPLSSGNPPLREQLVLYLRTQLRLHVDGVGQFTPPVGFWDLHTLLLREFDPARAQVSASHRFGTESGRTGSDLDYASRAFFELCADVFVRAECAGASPATTWHGRSSLQQTESLQLDSISPDAGPQNDPDSQMTGNLDEDPPVIGSKRSVGETQDENQPKQKRARSLGAWHTMLESLKGHRTSAWSTSSFSDGPSILCRWLQVLCASLTRYAREMFEGEHGGQLYGSIVHELWEMIEKIGEHDFQAEGWIFRSLILLAQVRVSVGITTFAQLEDVDAAMELPQNELIPRSQEPWLNQWPKFHRILKRLSEPRLDLALRLLATLIETNVEVLRPPRSFGEDVEMMDDLWHEKIWEIPGFDAPKLSTGVLRTILACARSADKSLIGGLKRRLALIQLIFGGLSDSSNRMKAKGKLDMKRRGSASFSQELPSAALLAAVCVAIVQHIDSTGKHLLGDDAYMPPFGAAARETSSRTPISAALLLHSSVVPTSEIADHVRVASRRSRCILFPSDVNRHLWFLQTVDGEAGISECRVLPFSELTFLDDEQLGPWASVDPCLCLRMEPLLSESADANWKRHVMEEAALRELMSSISLPSVASVATRSEPQSRGQSHQATTVSIADSERLRKDLFQLSARYFRELFDRLQEVLTERRQHTIGVDVRALVPLLTRICLFLDTTAKVLCLLDFDQSSLPRTKAEELTKTGLLNAMREALTTVTNSLRSVWGPDGGHFPKFLIVLKDMFASMSGLRSKSFQETRARADDLCSSLVDFLQGQKGESLPAGSFQSQLSFDLPRNRVGAAGFSKSSKQVDLTDELGLEDTDAAMPSNYDVPNYAQASLSRKSAQDVFDTALELVTSWCASILRGDYEERQSNARRWGGKVCEMLAVERDADRLMSLANSCCVLSRAAREGARDNAARRSFSLEVLDKALSRVAAFAGATESSSSEVSVRRDILGFSKRASLELKEWDEKDVPGVDVVRYIRVVATIMTPFLRDQLHRLKEPQSEALLHWHTRFDLCQAFGGYLQLPLEKINSRSFNKAVGGMLAAQADCDLRVRIHAAVAHRNLFDILEDSVNVLEVIAGPKGYLPSGRLIHPPLLKRKTFWDEKRSQSYVALYSSMLCVGEAIVRDTSVEEHALMYLCQLVAIESGFGPDLIQVATRLVSNAAYLLHHRDAKSFVRGHIPQLVTLWLSRGHPLSDFPSELVLGFESKTGSGDLFNTLVTEFASEIVPRVVLHGNGAELEEVADALGVSRKDLIEQQFAAIAAHTFPLWGWDKSRHGREKPRAQRSLNVIFSEIDQKAELLPLVSRNLPEILTGMVALTRHDDETGSPREPPEYPPNCVVFVFQWLAKQLEQSSSVPSLLSEGGNKLSYLRHPDCALRVLLSMRLAISSAGHRRQHKVRAFKQYCWFATQLDLRVAFPATLREVLRTLLSKISDIDLQRDALVYLNLICEKIFESEDQIALDQLSRHVTALVTTVSEYARKSQHTRAITHSARPTSNRAFVVLETVINGAAKCTPNSEAAVGFRKAVADSLDPAIVSEGKDVDMWRPLVPALNDIDPARFRATEKPRESLQRVVERFLRSNDSAQFLPSSLDDEVLRTKLKLFHTTIENRRDEVKFLAQNSKGIELLGRLQDALLRIGTRHSREDIILLTASVCGELGLHSWQDDSFCSGADVVDQPVFDLLFPRAVEMLASMLVDDAADQASVAAGALCGISAVLTSDQRTGVASELRKGGGKMTHIFEFIEPFWNSGGATSDQIQDIAPHSLRAHAAEISRISNLMPGNKLGACLNFHDQSIDLHEAWPPVTLPFGEWLKVFVSRLCLAPLCMAEEHSKQVKGTGRSRRAAEDLQHTLTSAALIFLSLAPVCTLRADFAGQILPHLLLHLVAGDIRAKDSLPGDARRKSLAVNLNSLFCMNSDNEADATQYASDPVILDAVLFLRFHTRPHQYEREKKSSRSDCADVIERSFWHLVDLLQLSEVSLRLSSANASLLFLEDWCVRENKNGVLSYPGTGLKPGNDTRTDDLFSEDQYSSLQGQGGIKDAGNWFGMEAVSQKADRLLVEGLRQSRQLDVLHGARAVISTPGHQLQTDVLILEADGEWNRLRGIYDQQARHAFETKQNTLSLQATSRKLLDVFSKLGEWHSLELYLEGIRHSVPQIHLEVSLLELSAKQAWRACRFEDAIGGFARIDDAAGSERAVSFHESLFRALRSLHSGDENEFKRSVRSGRINIMHDFSNASKTDARKRNETILSLQSLREIECAWSTRWSTRDALRAPRQPDNKQSSNLLQRWRDGVVLEAKDKYSTVETTLDVRASLLRVLTREDNSSSPSVTESRFLLDLAQLARDSDRSDLSLAFLDQVRGSQPYTSGPGERVVTENMLWQRAARLQAAITVATRGDVDGALSSTQLVARELRDDIQRIDRHTEPGLVAIANALLGECMLCTGSWLAETNSDSGANISLIMCDARKLFESVESYTGDRNLPVPFVAPALADAKNGLSRSHLAYAKFMDSRFSQAVAFTQSWDWQQEKEIFAANMRALDDVTAKLSPKQQHIRRTDNEKRDLRILKNNLTNTVKLDRERVTQMAEEKLTWLHSAIANYLRCLRLGDSELSSHAVFRLISLWFDFNERPDEQLQQIDDVDDKLDINLLVEKALGTIPSHRFLPLVYQIASRLTSQDGERVMFQRSVRVIIGRLLKHFPHHTGWQLFALARGGDPTKSAKHAGVSKLAAFSADKVQAAKDLVAQYLDKQLGMQMQKLAQAIIQCSGIALRGSEKGQPVKLPGDLAKLGELSLVPVITCEVPHTADAEKTLPHVVEYEKTCESVGGVNAPKKVRCRGSDGEVYEQLIKGEDDLRQDAVMKQIFEVANSLLRGKRATRIRGLRIATYKIVPLSPKTGILEFISDSQTIGDYLTGPGNRYGAHHKYRPVDLLGAKCREKMDNAHSRGTQDQTYGEITKRFLPVMHNFFLERYEDPRLWGNARAAYTRSVAANSMIGYIVGLGDRHTQNILIANNTAEMVHIDFGVTFEQGRVLRTPETVPFRLTRDLVDGMGVLGYDGMFRRSCEETLKVLRRNVETLLTIVEVFIHDPLYNWSLTDEDISKRQQPTDDGGFAGGDMLDFHPVAGRGVAARRKTGPRGGSASASSSAAGSELAAPSTRNAPADRAILRIKQKLHGVEYGEPLGVEGQIKRLVLEATDPARLSKLFPGWAPWV